MVSEKECLQRQAGLCFPTEELRAESHCLYNSMPKDLSYSKSFRIKSLNKQMFGWKGYEVVGGLSVYCTEKDSPPPSAIILIPKSSVKKAARRNLLRRRAKEVFRKGVNRNKSMDYLIKFNKFIEGFENNLEGFFKNV